jgi:type I restriction enzyme S subunit
MKWEQKTLAELCNKLTDGTHDSPKLQTSGIPFIKGVHVKQGIIDFENCDYITYEDHEKVIKRSKPEKNDILLANIGINIGELGYVKTDIEFSIKNVALLKVNPDIIDSKYLYYNLKNPSQQERLRNYKGGSAQPFLSLETLRGYTIKFHKFKITQRKIATILSAYDDLIENNLKRIKLLEEKAQLHYKELMQEMSYSKNKREEYIKDCLTFYIGGGWGEEDYKEGFTEPAYVIRGTDIPDAKKGEIKNVRFAIIKNQIWLHAICKKAISYLKFQEEVKVNQSVEAF